MLTIRNLLLSHPVDREVRAGGLDMSPVVFTFDPALTRINFRIKKESSLTDALHLNVLRMYNLKSSGNCTHNGNRIIWDTSSAPTNTFWIQYRIYKPSGSFIRRNYCLGRWCFNGTSTDFRHHSIFELYTSAQ